MTINEQVAEAEANILDGITNLHSQLIDANVKAAEQLEELRNWTPPAPEVELPEPTEAVKNYYEFAGKLLEANRKFAEQIVAVWYPTEAPKAKKAAAK